MGSLNLNNTSFLHEKRFLLSKKVIEKILGKVDQNFTQPERSVTVTPPSTRQQSKRNMFLSYKEDSPSPPVRPKTKGILSFRFKG